MLFTTKQLLLLSGLALGLAAMVILFWLQIQPFSEPITDELALTMQEQVAEELRMSAPAWKRFPIFQP
jgi:hypothetical protein